MTPSTPIEDRLRAHFADRTAREPLPGPSTDEALADIATTEAIPLTTRRPSSSLWLAAAAVLVALGTGAAVLVLQPDDTIRTGDPDENADPELTDSVPPTSPTTTPSTTPTTTASTTSVPTGPALPEGMTLVLGGGGPIGGWDGDSWIADEAGWRDVLHATGEEEYRLIRLAEPITTQTGRLADACGDFASDDDLPEVPEVDWPTYAPLAGGYGIAVTGVADPRPRTIQVMDPSDPAYVTAARDVLAGLGITDDAAPKVVAVVRADLDGDGSSEDVVQIERHRDTAETDATPGDYGVVFLRHSGGTRVVKADVTETGEQSLERYAVDALADLNGDGRMEIVTHAFYMEEHGQAVATFNADGTVTEVLEDGCGF